MTARRNHQNPINKNEKEVMSKQNADKGIIYIIHVYTLYKTIVGGKLIKKKRIRIIFIHDNFNMLKG